MRAGDRPLAEACGLCGGTERKVLATRGRGFTPLVTAVCTGCGLVGHHPLPDAAEVAAFYASRYRVEYKGSIAPKRKHALRAIRGALARMRRLAPLLPPRGAVLDVGASSGEFVYAMACAGFDATGIEPNRGYGEYGATTYGVRLQFGGFEIAEAASGSLDLVTMNHVLEHIADPWDALRRIHGWLKPDGLLFVEVPNLAGVRKQAANTFHPAHIWNFTPETLEAVAFQAGFVPRPGEDARSTSVVFRKRGVDDAPPARTGPALAERIAAQVAEEQSALAYLLSGAPFTRRWHRLRRNVDEALLLRRHASVRAMADALIAAEHSAHPAPAAPGGA